MEPTLEHSFATEQGVVRWGVIGEGPAIVLVHGTPWSSYSYHHLIDALSKSNRVYFYDLIGYGRSEMKQSQKVSLDIQSEIFRELMDDWQLENPVVIAHDFGGAISLRAHLLHDMKYARLVLMNVVAIAPWGSPFFAHVREHESAFAGVPDYIHRAILEAYIKGAMHASPIEDDLERLLSPWLTEKGKAAFYRQIAQADQKFTDDIQPLYGNISCPVRILWGENDEWIPIEIGRKLHDAIPQSEFFPISNAGHLVQLENPNDVIIKIESFLD